jgi:ubiquitin-protein ligase
METNNTQENELLSNKLTLTTRTVKRLVNDVKDILKKPLEDSGIYYIHDDENMLFGYALIIGPKNTPYENGLYFFKFIFPKDYPFSPPKVTFLTNNGECRFHPNMYRNGKVCLSVLNTWKGDGWTSCNNIRSILLIIQSVMDEIPLLHEPGILMSNVDVTKYTESIRYNNISFSILYTFKKLLIEKSLHHPFMVFFDVVRKLFNTKKNEYDIYIQNYMKTNKQQNNSTIHVKLYNMNTCICINKLENMWVQLQDAVKIENTHTSSF